MEISRNINIEILRARIVEQLADWVESIDDADHPFVGMAEGGMLTPRQILEEVENSTELGDMLVQHWVQLTLDQVVGADLQS